MKVNILGTEYEIIKNVEPNDEDLNGGFGVTIPCRKQIKIIDLYKHESWKDEPIYAINMKLKELLRHEIIHAFITESGLGVNAIVFNGAWVMNEEMIDWFAIQSPKIYNVFEQLDLIELDL